jgi:hypothetical protein
VVEATLAGAKSNDDDDMCNVLLSGPCDGIDMFKMKVCSIGYNESEE